MTKLRRYVYPLFFLVISFAPFLVLTIVPMIYAFYLSFTEWTPVATKFIGTENYQLLASDPVFLESLVNTVRYVLVVVPLVTLVPLGVALVLNERIRLNNFIRLSLFVPVVAPTIVIGYIWKWIYNPAVGPLSTVTTLDVLGTPSLVLPGIAIAAVWQAIGHFMLYYIAGLKNISQEVYDASLVDGTNRFQRFRYITLPLLRPTFLFIVSMAIIWNFQQFDFVFIMTRGGPSYSSSTVVYYIYQQAFQYFRMSYGCALSYILFVIILGVSVYNIRSLRKQLVT